MSKMKRWGALAALVGALAGSVCGGAAAQNLDKVIFAKAAPWGLVDAQIAFAMDLGFFAQERIDPQFVVVGGSYAAIQQILSGTAQTGYIGTEAIPTALQPGNTAIPMRLVYNYHRTPIFEMMVPVASPVKTLADLKGRKIGVLSLTTGNVPVTKAAMGSLGIAPADYTLLPVGAGPQAVQALTSGQIDALNLWYTLHAQIAEAGVAMRRIPFPGEFDQFPSTGLGFSDAYLKTNADTVARYGRAMTKGTVACIANKPACVHALWKLYPTTKPAGDEAKAMETALRILDVSFTRLVPPAGQAYGSFSQADWDNLLKALLAGKAITSSALPMDRIYTNAYVGEFNKFDRAAVEAAAKAAR